VKAGAGHLQRLLYLKSVNITVIALSSINILFDNVNAARLS